MSNYLEIDAKILENKLLLETFNEDTDDFENLLRSQGNYSKENEPWKFATPTPGVCLKTTDVYGQKVFINICKLDDIPEPKDISEEALLELLHSEEETDYKIPLSIQDPHDEFDKSGNAAVAYDVAVNTKYFKKIQENRFFQSFLMQVILEGVENKYNVQLKKEGYVILQNRNFIGELRPHRIRKSKSVYQPPKRLIEELPSSEIFHNTKDKNIEKEKKMKKSPNFRLYENERDKILIGEFHLPDIINCENINLDVGEDRIILEIQQNRCLVDVFVPVKVNERQTAAEFSVEERILTVRMPIVTVS